MIIGGMILCKVCLLLRRYSGSRGPYFLCQKDGWILGLISQQVEEMIMSCLRLIWTLLGHQVKVSGHLVDKFRSQQKDWSPWWH